MSKRSGATEGLVRCGDYLYDLDGLAALADTGTKDCPPSTIPEWLHEYQLAAAEIGRMLATGDHGADLNDLLRLRSRIYRRLREMTTAGARYGYHPRTTRWFVQDHYN